MLRLLFSAFALVAALLSAPTAEAGVGFQHFDIPDPKGGAALEVGVWYPTTATGEPYALELYTQTVAENAPLRGSRLPLVVMSHGHGGSYAGHYDTALALAEAGFVAAAVTHDGDSWRNSSHATRLEERPRQLEVLTSYMLDRWRDHDRLDPAKVAAFGFSAGGFTVLALAGGEPDLQQLAPHCRERPAFEDCRIVASEKIDTTTPRTWTHDPRVKAIVVASPAIGFAFGKAGLAKVKAHVQLWRGEDDPVLPHPFYAEAVRWALPTPPEMHVVPFTWVTTSSSARARWRCRSAFLISARTSRASTPIAFHHEFNHEVVRFLTQALAR